MRAPHANESCLGQIEACMFNRASSFETQLSVRITCRRKTALTFTNTRIESTSLRHDLDVRSRSKYNERLLYAGVMLEESFKKGVSADPCENNKGGYCTRK
jgi:hypothetical protein